ncbi:MAG: IS701 family transposase [Desulfobacteraceae bacterium]|nr:IS701 family transposase [Desulfobacteraceae bacterium]
MGKAPEPNIEARFHAYAAELSTALGHSDRVEPFRAYCMGLLLPVERKSVEPMAAQLAPGKVSAIHQSLHHFVAKAAWRDEPLLKAIRDYVLPRMQSQGPILAWIIDDTGFPKKGKHSVGVTRQYCGQLGKQDNCQVAVSVSVATAYASLPVAYRLYVPEKWAEDKDRCNRAGIPEEVLFQTKPEIALDQLRALGLSDLPRGVVLADAGYGNETEFRKGIRGLKLPYVLGIQKTTLVWPPAMSPLPPPEYTSFGRPPKLPRLSPKHAPVSVLELAQNLPDNSFQTIAWREGTNKSLSSRFALVRVREAHRYYWRSDTPSDEWLLIEWPQDEPEPTKYWLSNLNAQMSPQDLVYVAKLRWRIERDYQELKQEIGLGHFEGRGWRGFHHHATLCIAAYGFLVAERSSFPPSASDFRPSFTVPQVPKGWRPRGSPH